MAPPGYQQQEEEHYTAPMDSRLAWRLLRYATPYRKWMAFAVALVLLVTALDLAGPLIVKQVIDGPLAAVLSTGAGGAVDGAAGEAAPTVDRQARFRELLFWAGIYVVVIVLYIFLRFGQSMLMSVIGKRVTVDVRMDVFSHLQRMPMAFFDRSPVGRLVTRISNDVEALNQLFTSGVVVFIADVVVLSGIAVLLIVFNLTLALVTLSVLPFLLLLTFVFRHYARKFYREQRTHLANLNAYTQESIQGMDVIHLFVREEDSRRRFGGINRRYLDTFLKTVFCYSVYFPGLEILGAAAQVAILCIGGLLIGRGELSFGEFYLFWKFVNRFFAPVRDMAERYNVMQSAMTAAERIFKILDEPESITNPPDAKKPEKLRGEVEFQNVWFAYTGNDWAVRELSFRVEPGETVAIVGATGAGKSTVVNLLTRLYEPQRGRILVDGVELPAYDKHALRSRMAIVLQDPFLFTTTILENIALGHPEITRERAREAATRVHADPFISRLPHGYHERLRERGSTLSVGERQLISFARALAHDPDVLILDEATAHVDTGTERLIQSALEELLAGRTSLVIAHRLSTIQRADRILVFHKGELRESGTHGELLDKRGIYFRLYELHSGGAGVL